MHPWLEEFYPPSTADTDPLAHSLQKWKGLLPENLERHGCYMRFREVLSDADDHLLSVSSGSCALCAVYLGEHCEGCPIEEATGGCTGRPGFAWGSFVIDWDVKPMIKILQEKYDDAARA